jgi:hypothetical protein
MKIELNVEDLPTSLIRSMADVNVAEWNSTTRTNGDVSAKVARLGVGILINAVAVPIDVVYIPIAALLKYFFAQAVKIEPTELPLKSLILPIKLLLLLTQVNSQIGAEAEEVVTVAEGESEELEAENGLDSGEDVQDEPVPADVAEEQPVSEPAPQPDQIDPRLIGIGIGGFIAGFAARAAMAREEVTRSRPASASATPKPGPTSHTMPTRASDPFRRDFHSTARSTLRPKVPGSAPFALGRAPARPSTLTIGRPPMGGGASRVGRTALSLLRRVPK